MPSGVRPCRHLPGLRQADRRLSVLVAVFLVVSSIMVLALAPTAYAWDDCPRGLVEDPYPGRCSLYVDTNGDGICDHSQAAPASVEPASQSTQPASSPNIGSTSTTVMVSMTPVVGVSGTSGGGGGIRHRGGATSDASTANAAEGSAAEVQYNLGPITLAFLAIYVGSFVLARTKRISLATHRKVWNLLLLVTFLITGVLGVLLVIRLNFGLQFVLPFNMLFWHVEAGIVMTLISIFHIGWHRKYYRHLLRRRRERV